jgi:hypothetical protein
VGQEWLGPSYFFSVRPSKQPLMVRTFPKVYGSWLLFFVSARTNKRRHHHHQRVAQLIRSPHGLFNIKGLQQGDSASELDLLQLSIPETGYPSPEVPTSRMPVQTLRNRYIR